MKELSFNVLDVKYSHMRTTRKRKKKKLHRHETENKSRKCEISEQTRRRTEEKQTRGGATDRKTTDRKFFTEPNTKYE